MRKRRCFADKELEAVMYERERQLEMEKIKTAGIVAQNMAAHSQAGRFAQLGAGQHSPKQFLCRIFPSINPNVLELVYQGCGGNLERTIEQLVSNVNVQGARMLQQNAMCYGAKVPSVAGIRPQMHGKVGQSAFTQVVPSAVCGAAVPPPAHVTSATAAYQTLIAQLPMGIQARPQLDSKGNDILSAKSAFHSNWSPSSRSPSPSARSPSYSVGSAAPDQTVSADEDRVESPPSRVPSPQKHRQTPETCPKTPPNANKTRSPIKFSVASMIAWMWQDLLL